MERHENNPLAVVSADGFPSGRRSRRHAANAVLLGPDLGGRQRDTDAYRRAPGQPGARLTGGRAPGAGTRGHRSPSWLPAFGDGRTWDGCSGPSTPLRALDTSTRFDNGRDGRPVPGEGGMTEPKSERGTDGDEASDEAFAPALKQRAGRRACLRA
jgi:hypothetical protein